MMTPDGLNQAFYICFIFRHDQIIFKKYNEDNSDNLAVGGYGADGTIVMSLDGYGDVEDEVTIDKLKDRKAQKHVIDKFLSSLE